MPILSGGIKRDLADDDSDEIPRSRVRTQFDRNTSVLRSLKSTNSIKKNYIKHSNITSGYSRPEHFTSGRISPMESAPVVPNSSICGVPARATRIFSGKASVILIGMHGSGKSTLAVMLAAATGRRLIESDHYFQSVTGSLCHALKRKQEFREYKAVESQIMILMLEEYKEGCVIVCGSNFMGQGLQKLLSDYMRTNPIIHVVRDAASIQQHLDGWSLEKVNRFLMLSRPLYRACSNFEFFNVSELKSDTVDKRLYTESHQRPSTATPFLALKRVQRDFLKFAAFITEDNGALQKLHAALPLSSLPIESRIYTYAVTLPLSILCDRSLGIDDLALTADAVELRIDLPNSLAMDMKPESTLDGKVSQATANVRRAVAVPTIYHVQREYASKIISSSTAFASNYKNKYLHLVMLGLRLAPEFLTLDLSFDDPDISEVIKAKGQTKIIGHFFSPNSNIWEGDEGLAIYNRAARLGCDIVRITRPAVTMEDNLAVQRFRHRINTLPHPHIPLIAFNSGILGRLSCWSNPMLTTVTHPSLRGPTQRASEPPLSVYQAQQALFASFTLDPLDFYVFGANVMNSLSPAMHTAGYKACGMPHNYSPYQATSLRSIDDLTQDPNFGGCSINLPFKIEIVPMMRSLSPHARAIGAVNTVLPIRNEIEESVVPQSFLIQLESNRAGPVKGMHGDNTDWIGIYQCVRRGLSPVNVVSALSTGLVIGAGGMARAAIYSMIHLGVKNIFIYNRTFNNAANLAKHYNDQLSTTKDMGSALKEPRVHVISSLADSWPSNFKLPTMVVSCIPAHGPVGKPAPCFNLPQNWLQSGTGGVLVELAHKPLKTPLIDQVCALSHLGWVAMDWLDVLPEQGFAQFELFTGRQAPRKLMREAVLKNAT